MSSPDIDDAVRRTVGIAALRRLRRMVDDDAMQRRSAARWLRPLGLAAVVLLAAAALLLIR